MMNSVDMAEIAARIDTVANEALQRFYIRKAAVELALPEQGAIEPDLENAAGAGK